MEQPMAGEFSKNQRFAVDVSEKIEAPAVRALPPPLLARRRTKPGAVDWRWLALSPARLTSPGPRSPTPRHRPEAVQASRDSGVRPISATQRCRATQIQKAVAS